MIIVIHKKNKFNFITILSNVVVTSILDIISTIFEVLISYNSPNISFIHKGQNLKKYLASLFLSLTLFSFSAIAETVDYTDFVAMQGDMETLNTNVQEQQTLVAKLSDDIGLMANRIIEMADRIVFTEELLAQSLTLLINNPDFAGTSSSNGTALTSPADNATLASDTPPTITTIPDAAVYLLYASTTPTFSAGNTISLYINSAEALNNKWSQVVTYANGSSEIYLAVKRIDGSTITSISNGVKVNF